MSLSKNAMAELAWRAQAERGAHGRRHQRGWLWAFFPPSMQSTSTGLLNMARACPAVWWRQARRGYRDHHGPFPSWRQGTGLRMWCRSLFDQARSPARTRRRHRVLGQAAEPRYARSILTPGS